MYRFVMEVNNGLRIESRIYTSLIKYIKWDSGELNYRNLHNIDSTDYNMIQIVSINRNYSFEVIKKLIENGVKHLHVDGLCTSKDAPTAELFKLVFNRSKSNKLINFRSAFAANLTTEQLEELLEMIRNNYKIYIYTYILDHVSYTNKLWSAIYKYNLRNVRGWKMVYSAIICLLCVGRFGGLGPGWKDVIHIIARYVHSTRYEPCWYLT